MVMILPYIRLQTKYWIRADAMVGSKHPYKEILHSFKQTIRIKGEFLFLISELSICHKFKFSNPYIFAT